MHQILAFIVSRMAFLWESAKFKIVDSEVSVSNGGDALLVVESKVLRMRFVRDRGQLLLDLQPVSASGVEWYSIDLIRRLLTGVPETSSLLDESYSDFLCDHMSEIEGRFVPGAWSESRASLERLKELRFRQMFGRVHGTETPDANS
ncbi:hypothetical protein CUD01_25230 [Cellulomonas uda]|uniref:Uncharacterized protein n=1 Tax=Cellulomonas uda TaxID=1714 RepID=A0A4Y3KC92_CELUD|nr:hypothetical protein CUD01_25230 [Cellulomonas uda]